MPSLTASVSDFCVSIAAIFVSLFHSILAVFYSVLALGQDILRSVLHLGRSFVKLALDLFQGITGLILSNIVIILVIGGAYYLYNSKYNQGTRKRTKK